ncbi:MAG: hypothetical protein HZA48_02055 [Planctomycetes bacterium]|nr:hypothetical protein [Planctomycetota bacterium]
MLKFVYVSIICMAVIPSAIGCASSQSAHSSATQARYENAVIEKIWNDKNQISFILDRPMNESIEIAIMPVNAEGRGSLFFKGARGNDLLPATPSDFKIGDTVHFMQRSGFLQEMMDTDGKNFYTSTTIIGWEKMMAGNGMGGGMGAQMQLCPKGMLLYSGTVAGITEESVKIKLTSKQDRLIASARNQAKLTAFAQGEQVRINYTTAADGSVMLEEMVK